ncbi:MAG: c-type cytochrome [SAR324 cluster bacterium]|nr:c-type cytochrome [SAR324 cluster bacterium]
MRIMLPSMALVLMTAAPVMAEDGKRIFNRKGCTSCHGVDAKTTVSGAYPKLAGQHKDYIVGQLQAFQSAARSSNRSKEMIPFARSLSAEQVEAVASYISSL